MIVAGALALGSAAAATTLLWSPQPERGDFSYASVAAVRDAAWAAAVIDGFGFTIAAFTVAIAVCLLAPARGKVLANIGAVLTAAGGTLFASGVISYGVLSWYATAPDAMSAEAGTALMAYFADNPMRIAMFQGAGLILFTLGGLLLSVALWRARSVPRWLPTAWAVLTVAQFGIESSRILDFVQAAVMAIFVLIAWLLVSRKAHAHPH
jgi:hypothetical protein